MKHYSSEKLGGRSNQGLHRNQNIHTTTLNSTLQAGPTISGTTEETRKWVIILSDQPLTEQQEEILARGPKFVIKPKRPPVEE